MKFRNAGLWLAGLCWLASAGQGRGQESRALTLGEAQARSLAANPGLAAQIAESDAARARAEREGLAPPMVASADLENFAGSGAFTGIDSVESTLQLTRTLELGGKRAGRRALGAAEVARADHGAASAGLDLRHLTALRFIEVAADQERLALSAERVGLAERTRAEVARVVGNARNPETDLRAAEIALADAELGHEHAEHELRAARVTLASLWRQREPDFERVVLSLDALAEPVAFERVAARLPASAALHSLTLDTEVAEARERLAASQARPDLSLSVGVRRLEAFGDHGLVAGVSVPLGSRPRAELARAESRAQANAARHRRDALEAEVYQQAYERHQELGHALAEFRALSDSMIPKAQQALSVAARGFDLGRFPFAVLAQSQETVFELRRRRIDAAARYHTLFAELQHLVAAVETP